MIIPPLTSFVPTAYRWGAYILIAIAYGGFCWLQGAHHEQLKGAKFEAATRALGDAALKAAKVETAQREANLKEIKRGLNQKLKAAGDVAVNNYVARYGMRNNCPGESGLPAPAASVPSNDAATGTIVAIDGAELRAEFIRACARTTAVLWAWQQYGELNRIPVK